MSEIIEELKVDKSTWGDGPWQSEPDKLNWEHAGMDCMIARHPSGGHLCGYVAVDPEHPFFEKPYSACVKGCSECETEYEHSPSGIVNVHGGLTYTNKCDGHLCHVPKPGRPDNVWWFGFDCAHSGDLSPGMESRLPSQFKKAFNGAYRDIYYVRHQTESLAEQLSSIKITANRSEGK